MNDSPMRRFSDFGNRFTRPTGALELMEDLGNAMTGEADVLMLGGGNPGRVPAIQEALSERLREIASNAEAVDRLLGNYAHPRGEHGFRESVAGLLRRELGWAVAAGNIALTGGSQSAFFMLFNLFGGRSSGSMRRVVLPMTPEYVGYSDVGLDDGLFVSQRPIIEFREGPYFKYRLDIERLKLDESTAAVCVSRPTNPTGNVLTDTEMDALAQACRKRQVPLIVDAAYGHPFPGIVFTDATPQWNENIIYCLSLSKLGLPAVRTGIVVADEETIEALTKMTAVMSLAVSSVGPVIVQPWMDDGSVLRLSRDHIKPFYQGKLERACRWLIESLHGVPYKIHEPEGALFLWVWIPGLPITSGELYRRLKAAGVFVLSGEAFFPGLTGDWDHRHECLRLSYAQDDDVVRRGIARLGEELRRVFDVGQ